MPKSMTGFGRGECVRHDRRFKIEMKSVNHRYSDVTIKLPRFLNPFEDRIRKRLAEDIVRGKVDVWVHFESFAQKDISINVNVSLADSYIEALAGLSSRYEFGKLQPELAMELLSRHPDIIMFDKFESTMNTETEQEDMWDALSEALEDALEQYNHMRNAEGQAMVEDIEGKCVQARQIVNEVAIRAPQALKEQASKYRDRIEEMLQKMQHKPDDSRIAAEMTILLDKGCISEEIARLQSHFAQLSVMLQENDAIGRKLDFLVQELNREANTIGSKSGDVEVTTLVVELKSLIEKMREQAQNIE